MILAFIKSNQPNFVMPEGFYRASRAFKMDSRLIPAGMTAREDFCFMSILF